MQISAHRGRKRKSHPVRDLRRAGDKLVIAAALNVLRNIDAFVQFSRQIAEIDLSENALRFIVSTQCARRLAVRGCRRRVRQ